MENIELIQKDVIDAAVKVKFLDGDSVNFDLFKPSYQGMYEWKIQSEQGEFIFVYAYPSDRIDLYLYLDNGFRAHGAFMISLLKNSVIEIQMALEMFFDDIKKKFVELHP